MSTNPAEVRTMLRTYGKQLSSAKRLARFKRALMLSGGQEQSSISRQAKRRELVQRIAKEIIENLIVNGDENRIIQDILEEMGNELGGRVMFEYPLDGGDVQILMETPAGPKEAQGEERMQIMHRLWETTLARVDQTML